MKHVLFFHIENSNLTHNSDCRYRFITNLLRSLEHWSAWSQFWARWERDEPASQVLQLPSSKIARAHPLSPQPAWKCFLWNDTWICFASPVPCNCSLTGAPPKSPQVFFQHTSPLKTTSAQSWSRPGRSFFYNSKLLLGKACLADVFIGL